MLQWRATMRLGYLNRMIVLLWLPLILLICHYLLLDGIWVNHRNLVCIYLSLFDSSIVAVYSLRLWLVGWNCFNFILYLIGFRYSAFWEERIMFGSVCLLLLMVLRAMVSRWAGSIGVLVLVHLIYITIFKIYTKGMFKRVVNSFLYIFLQMGRKSSLNLSITSKIDYRLSLFLFYKLNAK